MSGPQNAELQEALLELQQYLSDNVPPLVVADSVSILMKYPPQAVLPTIRGWTAGQYRGGSGSGVPVSDYLFHALKKIHMMAEFKLVAAEPMNAYLGQLKQAVMALCPEEDRQILSENLGRLGELATTTVSPVQQIHRQSVGAGAPMASAAAPKGAPAGAAAASDTAAVAGHALQGLKRVGLLLERLEAQGGLTITGSGVGGGTPMAGPPAAASQALAFAARSSQSREELEQTLARFKALGLETGTGDLFRALAQIGPGLDRPRRRRRGGGGRPVLRGRGDRRHAAHHHDRRGPGRGVAPLSRDGQDGRRPLQRGLPAAGGPDAGARRASRRREEGGLGQRRDRPPQARRGSRLGTAQEVRRADDRPDLAPQGAPVLHGAPGRGPPRGRSRASRSATAGGSCCCCSRSTARPRATEATSG